MISYRRIALLFICFLFLIVFPSLEVVPDSADGIPRVEAFAGRQQTPSRATVIDVIDGDTLVVRYRDRKEHLRLIGVDTPEARENDKLRRDARRLNDSQKNQLALGRAASEFTKRTVSRGSVVTLEFDVESRDHYGRLLAYLYLPNGKMLNAVIIAEGYGKLITIPPNTRYVDTFKRLMREARKGKRGLWGEEHPVPK